MTIDYAGLVTQGLAKQIADKIRAAILEGRLQVRERLPTEEELADRFNVSRPTIREALKRLAAQHFIRSRRGPAGGTFVSPPTREEARTTVANAAALLVAMGEVALSEVAEARHELELACCRLACQRRTKEHLESLTGEIDRQNAVESSDEDFCASDVRFHRTLVDAAGNSVLDFATAGAIESLQPAANLLVLKFRDRKQIARQHERLYAALKARDADAACAALTDYMIALRRHCRKAESVHGRSEVERRRVEISAPTP